MPRYLIQIGLIEGGEEEIIEDDYEAETPAEALQLAQEDYPGCQLYRVLREVQ